MFCDPTPHVRITNRRDILVKLQRSAVRMRRSETIHQKFDIGWRTKVKDMRFVGAKFVDNDVTVVRQPFGCHGGERIIKAIGLPCQYIFESLARDYRIVSGKVSTSLGISFENSSKNRRHARRSQEMLAEMRFSPTTALFITRPGS